MRSCRQGLRRGTASGAIRGLLHYGEIFENLAISLGENREAKSHIEIHKNQKPVIGEES
jgi:hypothetical protein